MGSNKKASWILQFNEMDFRHRRALEILRQRPRGMSELVVSAILHYTSCPEVADEHSKGVDCSTCEGDHYRNDLQRRVADLGANSGSGDKWIKLAADDLAELGGVMGMFRTKGVSI